MDKNKNVNLILGSVALESDIIDKSTNTCFVIDRNGSIVGRYLNLEEQKRYRKELPVLEYYK